MDCYNWSLTIFQDLFHYCIYYFFLFPNRQVTHQPCLSQLLSTLFSLSKFFLHHLFIFSLQLLHCLNWAKLKGPIPSIGSLIFSFPIHWTSPPHSPPQTPAWINLSSLCTYGTLNTWWPWPWSFIHLPSYTSQAMCQRLLIVPPHTTTVSSSSILIETLIFRSTVIITILLSSLTAQYNHVTKFWPVRGKMKKLCATSRLHI